MSREVYGIRCEGCDTRLPFEGNTEIIEAIWQIRRRGRGIGWRYVLKQFDASGKYVGRMIDLCPQCWEKKKGKKIG